MKMGIDVAERVDEPRTDVRERGGFKISPEDLQILKSRGYELGREVGEGEGATRRAFVSTRNSGNLRLEGVLLMPKADEQLTSLNARINRKKANRDLNEALISGKLKHPAIVRVLDSFQLHDGKTANFEDHIKGWSLNTFLRRAGPLTDNEKLRSIFLPVLDGMAYAHNQGILHRDLTPNNIVVLERGDGAVITDWQNAADIRDIRNLPVPSRGGTKETYPSLLNSLITGDFSSASKRTDAYALGATLYKAITGEDAFHYHISDNGKGRAIKIGDRTVSLGLQDGDKELKTITSESHERNLKTALKKVPKRFRKVLYGMLTLNPKKSTESVSEAREQFLKATDTTRKKFLENLVRNIKVGAITSLACLGVSAGAYIGMQIEANSSPSKEVTLQDVLMSQATLREYSQGNDVAVADMRRYPYINNEFQKYIEQARARQDEIGEKFEKRLDYMRSTGFSGDNRLMGSLIRSILLENDRAKIAGNDRYESTLVPKTYVKDLRGHMFSDEEPTDIQKELFMARYIQGSYSYGDSVEDVYVKALCSKDEVDKAISETLQSGILRESARDSFNGAVYLRDLAEPGRFALPTYFARRENYTENGKQYERIVPGFADKLANGKKRVIDRAVALYLLTDRKGKLDLEALTKSRGFK